MFMRRFALTVDMHVQCAIHDMSEQMPVWQGVKNNAKSPRGGVKHDEIQHRLVGVLGVYTMYLLRVQLYLRDVQ